MQKSNPKWQDLEVVRNTTKIYELVFTKDGVSQDITDWKVYFTVKSEAKDSDANAVISKTITSHDDPTNGKTLIELEPADTADLDLGNYYYSMDFKDDEDQEGVLFTGRFRLVKPIRDTRE